MEEAMVSDEKNGKRYLRIKKDAVISHGRGKSSEHASKSLPRGDYWVEIQQEFDHLKNEKREVID